MQGGKEKRLSYMKCANCGTELKDGTLFCPACKSEVQWVPEYHTLETILLQKQMREKSLKEKKQKKEEELRQKKRQEEIRKKKRRKYQIFGGSIAALILLAGVASFAIKRKEYNSFDMQMAQAESEVTNKNYESALNYLERALELQPDSTSAKILQAKIYTVNGEEEKALPILSSVIEKEQDNVSAYGELLRLYEKQKDYDSIKSLLDECDNEKVKSRYENYICEVPVISLNGGTYEKEQRIDFTAMKYGTKVYYTLDGSEPDKTNGTRYDSDYGIVLSEEGEYTLKYIAYNAKGIPSKNKEEVYKIEFKAPDAPKITPDSGQYEKATKIRIAVPSGCTAYYAFDDTVTTESTRYTGPVEMPEGEHIFSAILVNKNGKISLTASETYVFYQ